MPLLSDLHIWKLCIPLRITFRHASASRSVTSSIWVEAESSDGSVGFGESCPRPYVTGEDLDSCYSFFSAHRNELLREVDSAGDLKAWVAEHEREIDEAPAAWCAIELAVLDLLARNAGTNLEGLLGLPEMDGVFQYTAVLGDQAESAFSQQLKQYRGVGLQDFKVKLSGDLPRDSAKFALLKGEGVAPQHVRVDANNLWPTAHEGSMYLNPLATSFFAIEEPLKPGDYRGMRQLAESLGKVVILDESFQRVEQFAHIDSDRHHWLINLRISKMGGLLRSLEVARLAREKNIGLIIGAQVGETSLLTRAGLSVAQSARSVLRAQEGAFGKLLLETDVTDPPLAFGEGGRLAIPDHPSCRSPLAIIRPTSFLEEF